MVPMMSWSEVLPGNVQHRTGTPSAVTAMPITTWGRSGRWSLDALLNRRVARSTGPDSSSPMSSPAAWARSKSASPSATSRSK
jgi:hypothetical protein